MDVVLLRANRCSAQHARREATFPRGDEGEILRPVSKQNVEIVRRVWAAVERQDTEAVFAFYDPDIVWQDHTGALELQDHSYHGHEGVRQFWREWLEPFETFEAHSEAFIDAGDNVVVGFRLSGRGKASGAQVEWPLWNVYTIRNGLVIRIQAFETKGEALEAAGLAE
jgi:ketosteroid isomerase-like protein